MLLKSKKGFGRYGIFTPNNIDDEYFYFGKVAIASDTEKGFLEQEYLVDTNGNRISETYSIISSFDVKYAWVKNNEHYGMIDLTGKIVLPIQYKMIEYFEDNFFVIQDETYCMFMDKDFFIFFYSTDDFNKYSTSNDDDSLYLAMLKIANERYNALSSVFKTPFKKFIMCSFTNL